jgi:hypothetical protein
MLARLWSCRALVEKSEDYLKHLRDNVFPQLEGIEGFRGAYVLERPFDGDAEILVMTLWDSMESIRSFAGDDPTMAVVEDEAKAFMNRFDTTVKHFDIVIEKR